MISKLKANLMEFLMAFSRQPDHYARGTPLGLFQGKRRSFKGLETPLFCFVLRPTMLFNAIMSAAEP